MNATTADLTTDRQMRKLKPGTKVTVNNTASSRHGQKGRVCHVGEIFVYVMTPRAQYPLPMELGNLIIHTR